MRSAHFRKSLLGLAAVMAASAAQAQTAWNIDGSGTWSTGTNWSPTTAPVGSLGSGADVTLGNGPTTSTILRTITLDTSVFVGTLNANGTFGVAAATAASGYIIAASGSNTLTFDAASGNASISLTGATSPSVRINSGIILNDTLDITTASTGDTGGTSTTASVYLAGAVSGTGGIVKTGTGSLRLNSNYSGATSTQTFSGGVTLKQGNLILGSPSGGAAITALGTGTLTFDNTLSGGSISHNNLGFGTFANTGSVASPYTIANNISLFVGSATNSYLNWSHDVSNPGTLKFTGNWSSTAAITSDIIMQDAGGGGLIYAQNGSGLSFSGAGRFWLKNGNHFIDGANALGANNSAPIRLGRDGGSTDSLSNEASLYLLSNQTVTGNILMASISSNPAANRLRIGAVNDGITGAYNGNLTFNQSTSQDSARTVEVWAGPAGASASSTRITFGGVIADGSGVTNRYNVVKYGRGTAVFSGTNTYDGTTTVHDGTLLVNGDSSAANGAVTVNGAVAAPTSKTQSGSVTSTKGTTSITFVDTTGVSVGMAISGTGIAANTFVRSISGTTVTLTEATTANFAAGGSYTFSGLAGGTLGGTGTIGGATTINSGAFLTPGDLGTGTLTFTNGLTHAGTYTWELGALNTSTGFDKVVISAGNGDFTNASLALSLGSFAPSSDSFWTSNQSWTIVDNTGAGTIAGSFTITTDQSSWSSLGSFSVANVGNDVSLAWTASAIPEPSTYAALAGLGILGFAASRRRRRA